MAKAFHFFLLASLFLFGPTIGIENWDQLLDEAAVDTSHWINPNDMGFEENVQNDIHLNTQVDLDATSKILKTVDVSKSNVILSPENQNGKKEITSKSGSLLFFYYIDIIYLTLHIFYLFIALDFLGCNSFLRYSVVTLLITF